MKTFYISSLATIALITILLSCGEKNQNPEMPAEDTTPGLVILNAAQLRSGGIETGTATRKVMGGELHVNGLIDVPPQNIVSVSFPMGGYLKNTKLLPGMHVNKGEVIGLIEDQSLIQLQQDYLVSVARLSFLEQDYERQRILNESKVNADKVLQQVSADYTSQKILVKGYFEKLKLIGIDPARLNESNISRSVVIRSPIDGFVSRVNVNIGKFVNPTDVLFELINPDDMHAALTVFERDMSKIKAGQKVMVRFVDDPEKVYECEVILVTRNVNADRSGIVHCHFEQMPKNLLPGMFINATVQISNLETLSVPEEAVVLYSDKNFVFERKTDTSFQMHEVQPGLRQNGFVEIVSAPIDLTQNQIITKNAYAALGKMMNTGDE